MNNEDNTSRASREVQIRREAADWVVRCGVGLGPTEQDRFFDWLAEDPAHAEFYAEQSKVWRRLDILVDWRPEHSLRPNSKLLGSSKPPRNSILRVFWSATALAAVAATLLFLFPNRLADSPAAKLAGGVIARGYERHILDDGSILELNDGARASVKFSAEIRRVNLDAGEAYFTVARDGNRPFIVSAGGIAVQAIGTVFNVRLSRESVNILVREGRVQMREEADSESGLPEFKQEIQAGQRSIVDLDRGVSRSVVETLSEHQMAEQLNWLKDVIDFNEAPLEDIVREFNRRNERKIVIDDPAVARIPLSVTVRPNNIEDFVKLLRLTAKIETEKVDESTLRLVRTKP